MVNYVYQEQYNVTLVKDFSKEMKNCAKIELALKQINITID